MKQQGTIETKQKLSGDPLHGLAKEVLSRQITKFRKEPGLTKLTNHKKFHNGPIKFHKKIFSMNLLWFVSFHNGPFYGL